MFHLDVACVFIRMLYVLHSDVAYFAIAIHVCVEVYVSNFSSILDVCCKCFIWMLHMSQGYIHMLLQASIQNISYLSDVCCKCYIWMLHMLQLLYTYIASIYYKMFHLTQWSPRERQATHAEFYKSLIWFWLQYVRLLILSRGITLQTLQKKTMW
jgi:hypothetical protein